MMIGFVVSVNKFCVAVLNTTDDILMQNCIEVETAPLGYFFPLQCEVDHWSFMSSFTVWLFKRKKSF